MLQSLRARIAAAFGFGVLVLVTALSLVLSLLASSNALRDQGDMLQTLARSVATVLSEDLHERLLEVEWLASMPPRNGPGGWQAVIERLRQSRPQYSWIGVTDVQGSVKVASGDMLVGASVAERPWWKAGRASAHVGDVHAAKLLAKMLPPAADGEPQRFVDFAAPVFGDDGTPAGVLGVHATWDWARSVIDTMRSPLARENGLRVFIFDRHGQLVLRPLGETGEGKAVDLAALPQRGATIVAWKDGVEYLTSAWRLPTQRAETDMGWTIVARQPLGMALAPARGARNAVLLLGAVASLLASLLAWKLAGRFSKPLTRIAEAAKAVQAGRLDTPIPVIRGARELSDLSGALRDMTAELLRRERDLEQRVDERTRELSAATDALQKANAELKTMATRDSLTGLANRRAGDERLRQEFSRHRRSGRTLAVVIGDIDHFKKVNDTHGHAAGDTVLKDVAACLAQQVRSTDTVVRWGGEEFLVLMPETGADGAAIACEKLREAVAAIGGAVPVTISLGAAVLAPRFGSIEGALHAADELLYVAKAQGRNRVVLSELQPDATPAPYGDTLPAPL